jgi:hypothetical protein
MNKMKSLVALAILLPSMAMAATDGPLRISNTDASLTVFASVNAVIAIKHVDDIDFGNFSPGMNVTASDTVKLTEELCVYTNAAQFEIELDSFEGTNQFAMKGNSSGNSLPYNISLTSVQESAGTFFETLVDATANEGVTYGPFAYAPSYSDDGCLNSLTGSIVDNMKLDFELSGSDLVTAIPDDYFDSVTITARVIEASLPAPQ